MFFLSNLLLQNPSPKKAAFGQTRLFSVEKLSKTIAFNGKN